MELFTKNDVYIIDEDVDNPKRIDVTITNDTLDDPDHEFITVRFFSYRVCRVAECAYRAEFPPTEEDIAKLIAKWEHVDPSYVVRAS